MKNLIIIIISIIVLVSCNSSNQKIESGKYIISGKISGLKKNKIELVRAINHELQILHSTISTDGRFEFNGALDNPELLYLSIDNFNSYLPFFAENTHIEIYASRDSLEKATIKGATENDLFADFLENQIVYENKIQDLNHQLDKIIGYSDTLIINQLKNEIQYWKNEKIKFMVQYVYNNKSSYVALHIFYSKLINYIPLQEIINIADGFNETIKKNRQFLEIQKIIENEKKTQIGQPAPEYTFKDNTDRQYKLSDFKGYPVILFFWAIWNTESVNQLHKLIEFEKNQKNKPIKVILQSIDSQHLEPYITKMATNNNIIYCTNTISWQSDKYKIFGLKQIPYIIYIDKNGIIQDKSNNIKNIIKQKNELL